MTEPTFEKARKFKSKLRMALTGTAKSGKTYTALVLATALADGGRIGLIDTENRSSEKYADIFDFDIMELENAHPETFIAGIDVFEKAGHVVVILDSLSHAWIGKKGVLELHDDATVKSRSKDSYISWRTITPLHRALIDKMQSVNCHLIATMRSKMAYIRTTDDRGKTTIRKVGLAPVQRQGMEYEFDILAEMQQDHRILIGDSRCPAVDGQTTMKPDGAWFQPIIDWLDGEETPEQVEPHWMDNATERVKFWAEAGRIGLDKPTVHLEWRVESMKNTDVSYKHSVWALQAIAYALKFDIGLAGLCAATNVEHAVDLLKLGKNMKQIKADIDTYVNELSRPDDTIPEPVSDPEQEEIPF